MRRPAKRTPRPGRPSRPPIIYLILEKSLAILLVLAVVAISYVGWWFFMASQLRSGTEEWAEQRRAEGYFVKLEQLQLGGFPFLLRMTTDDPALGGPQHESPWKWSVEQVVATIRPWKPNQVIVTLSGDQALEITVDGRKIAYSGEVEKAVANIVFADGEPYEGQLKIDRLNLSAADAAWNVAAKSMSVIVQRDPDGEEDHRIPSMKLDISAKKIQAPRRLALPLGSRIAKLIFQADLMGTSPVNVQANALAAWRDQGGTVEVKNFELVTGPLHLKTQGTMALDETLQPIGAFTAQVRGFIETVDVFRRRGYMRSRDAITAKFVLGALAKKAADGGAPILNVPISIQNRKVLAGPATLAELPVVQWPVGH